MKYLSDLKKMMDSSKKMKLVVVAAEEENVLIAVERAYNDGIVEPVLVGNTQQIQKYITANGLNFDGATFVHSDTFEESAELSVKMVREGKADFLIKGLLDTSIILKAVLNNEWGLKTGRQLSHVMLYQIDNYHKLLMLTDGGMVTYPDLETKKQLVINAVEAARGLGYHSIKIAALAAKEKVNPKMQATIDGDALKAMSIEGEFGEGVFVEGPIAFDLAISKEAAQIKKYDSPVAGDADILLVPNIEMGNGIGKAISYFGNGIGAGVVMGAKAPIVLVSRSDSFESKYYSILFGGLIALNQKNN